MRHTSAVRVLAVVGIGLAVTACGSNGTTEGEPAATAETVTDNTTAAPVTVPASDPTETAMDEGQSMDEMETDSTATDDTDHDDMDEMETDSTGMDDADHDEMEAAAAWPRPWDPSQPIDFSGVPGVTAEQQAFAEKLAADTIADLPAFADPASIEDLGYASIGDEATGYEHYINAGYLLDDHFLDPNYPESLVYEVDGNKRTLASAMFMVADKEVDDPELVEVGGPLMQWHIHNDLCWELTPDGPQVAGVHEPGTPCPDGQIAGGEDIPMVHVWILPHQCGPFAALEGIGAGQVDPDAPVRMDQCHGDH